MLTQSGRKGGFSADPLSDLAAADAAALLLAEADGAADAALGNATSCQADASSSSTAIDDAPATNGSLSELDGS
jgi:hypothetical protein